MRKALSILLVFLMPMGGYAQLTLDRCMELAREHYPEIAQYGLISATEQYNVKSASNNWIPQITLSGQASWQSAVASFPDQLKNMLAANGLDLPGIAKDQYRIALDINQTIWDGGQSKAQKRIAQADAAQQRLSSDVSIYSLQDRICNLFFGILLLDENYQSQMGHKELIEANLSRLQSMREQGLALQSDLDLLQVELLTLGQQIDQNRSSRESYVAVLSLFTGQDITGMTLVKPEQRFVQNGTNNRPELQLIDARIEGMNARKALLDAQVMPRVNLFAQGFYGNPGLDMFKSMSSREWTWNAMLGVRVQWNVSALITRKHDLLNLDNSRGMLSAQRETFTFNSNITDTQMNGDIGRMQKALESDDEIVELRARIRRTAESELENGTINTASLLQRMTQESDARTARSIHEIELLKAQYEMKILKNQQ